MPSAIVHNVGRKVEALDEFGVCALGIIKNEALNYRIPRNCR